MRRQINDFQERVATISRPTNHTSIYVLVTTEDNDGWRNVKTPTLL